MADRPIIFSAPMVRALLDGRKTQTRRLIPSAAQDAYHEYDDWCRNVSAGVPTSRQWEADYYRERSRIQVGDVLWVRESVQAVTDAEEFDAIRYLADDHVERSRAETREQADRFADQLYGYRGRKHAPDRKSGVPVPSIHMPRWASRLTLIVADVRIERLQAITHDDARAEGILRHEVEGGATLRDLDTDAVQTLTVLKWSGAAELPMRGMERRAFQDLWESINGAGSWAENPFVAAYSFRVERRNIDEEAR